MGIIDETSACLEAHILQQQSPFGICCNVAVGFARDLLSVCKLKLWVRQVLLAEKVCLGEQEHVLKFNGSKIRQFTLSAQASLHSAQKVCKAFMLGAARVVHCVIVHSWNDSCPCQPLGHASSYWKSLTQLCMQACVCVCVRQQLLSVNQGGRLLLQYKGHHRLQTIACLQLPINHCDSCNMSLDWQANVEQYGQL